MIHHFLSKLSQLNTLYIGSLLFLVGIFCYGNTLGNGLFFDDEQFIYNNPYVKTFDLTGFFSRSLSSESGQVSNYYRPLLFLSFGVEYLLFKDSGFIYHFDSFLLHFVGSLLIFILIKSLFKSKPLALLTSFFFLIHPIQTEAVAYASGRGDPLSLVFILLTLLFVLAKNKKYHLLACVTLVAALLSKEVALMTPGLIFIVLLFSKKSFSRQAFISAIVQTLPYAIITVVYFLLRVTVLNFNNTLNFYNSQNIYSGSLFVRLATFFNLFPSYVGLLLYPKTLFMERDSAIQIVTSPTLPALLSLLGLAGLFAIGIWKRKMYPVILFSSIWVAIAFVPASGIIPINGIFYEHFLYFPSVGFFLLLSFCFLLIYRKLPILGKDILGICLILSLAALSFRTIARNSEWHDAITFYTQTLSHVQSPRAYNNLAMAYADNGDNQHAVAAYKKAIQLADAYPESHYNLANSYLALNDNKDAEKEYKNALKINPTFYLSYIKLYSLYKATNNTEGLEFVHSGLTTLGKYNPQFLTLLHQLENQ